MDWTLVKDLGSFGALLTLLGWFVVKGWPMLTEKIANAVGTNAKAITDANSEQIAAIRESANTQSATADKYIAHSEATVNKLMEMHTDNVVANRGMQRTLQAFQIAMAAKGIVVVDHGEGETDPSKGVH